MSIYINKSKTFEEQTTYIKKNNKRHCEDDKKAKEA